VSRNTGDLDLRRSKEQEAGEEYVMRSFAISRCMEYY
jgi:hypothetical protein